jgi:hypothetical protein
VQLGRCPYLFAQGTCSNRQMTSPRLLLHALLTREPDHSSNGCASHHLAHCYCDPHNQCVVASPAPVATVICVYIYIAPSSSQSKVHSEFVTLSVRWLGKIEKRGGKVLISFFLEGLLLEGKSMSLLKFLLLFRCDFEAMFKVKVNLGVYKLFYIKYMFVLGV